MTHSADHILDESLPRRVLNKHVRLPHAHGPDMGDGENSRIERIATAEEEIAKWDKEELIRAHRELHGWPR